MAVEQTGLDFKWRTGIANVSLNSYVPDNPPALENNLAPGQGQIKCYRNVIYTWLFHTPLLTNWIDDRHRLRCEYQGDIARCAICRFRDLARRFWSASRGLDTAFNEDVDRFWRDAMFGRWDWNEQNDAQEYMEKLFEYFDASSQSDPQWTKQLISPHLCHLQACTQCPHQTQRYEQRPILKASMPRKDITYQTLERSLQLHRQLESIGPELCDTCNKSTQHAKAHPLVFAPPILPIHVEPAVTDTYDKFFRGSLTKLEPLMTFSSYAAAATTTDVTATDSVDSMNPSTLQWNFYHLYGVILRLGATPAEGHYVGAFEQEKGHWLLFDDVGIPDASRATSLKEIEEKQKDGWRVFLLAYRRLFHVPVQGVASTTTASTASTAAAGQLPANPPANPPVPRGTQVQPQKRVEAGSSTARGTKRRRDESQSQSQSQSQSAESERQPKKRAKSKPAK